MPIELSIGWDVEALGDISWDIFTWYSLEKSVSPLAHYLLPFFLQKGVFVITKLFNELLLSWLSIIKLLVWDKFVKPTFLEIARGIAQITFFAVYLLIFLFEFSQITVIESLIRLSIVITWWSSLKILLIEFLIFL